MKQVYFKDTSCADLKYDNFNYLSDSVLKIFFEDEENYTLTPLTLLTYDNSAGCTFLIYELEVQNNDSKNVILGSAWLAQFVNYWQY